MKIVLTLVIELTDPEEWAVTYGVKGLANIRQDVKEHIAGSIAPDGSLFGNREIDMKVGYR